MRLHSPLLVWPILFSANLIKPPQAVALAESADQQMTELTELSLKELLKIKVNVSGLAGQNFKFSETSTTANPFLTQLIDSVESIQIVDSKTIEARGLHNVIEVVETVPGVIFGESPSEPYSFSIRGFDRDSVNVLFDGVSMGQSVFNMRPQGTNNLERVEVLKGPSFLFGEGAAGGTINMLPKRADLSDQHHFKSLQLSTGDFAQNGFGAEFKGPLNQNAAYLINLDYQSSSGWVERSDSQSTSANFSLTWAVNERLELTFSYDYFTDNLPGYWGTPLVPAENAIRPVYVAISSENLVIDETTRLTNYNVSDYTIESTSRWNAVDLDWQVNDNIKIDAKAFVFSAERLWENAESYFYEPLTNMIDRDRLLVEHDTSLNGIHFGFKHNSKISEKDNQFYAMLEYRSLDFARVVGFEPINFIVDSVSFIEPTAGLFNRDIIETRDDTYLQKTAAIILTDKLSISENLNWETTIRFENINYELTRFNFDHSLRSSQKDSIHQQSYKSGINYRVSPKISLYGHYSFQHDNLARALVASASEDIDNFDSSDVIQKEIGIRYSSEEKQVETNLVFFDIQKLQDVNNDVTLVENELTSKGAELSSQFSISDDTKIGVTYASIDANFGTYFDTEYWRDVSHNQPINVPDSKASLWATSDNLYSKPIEVGANIQYVSSRWADTTNTVSLKGYKTLNAFIAYTGENYRISLYGRNLTDEIYAPWSDLFYPQQVILGKPRSIELNFRYFFE